jgi:hypothetical protein
MGCEFQGCKTRGKLCAGEPVQTEGGAFLQSKCPGEIVHRTA